MSEGLGLSGFYDLLDRYMNQLLLILFCMFFFLNKVSAFNMYYSFCPSQNWSTLSKRAHAILFFYTIIDFNEVDITVLLYDFSIIYV